MKKIFTSIMALAILLSPVLAAVPEGVAIEPLLSVSSENQGFLKEYGIFQEHTVGEFPITRAEIAKIIVQYLQKSEGELGFNKRGDDTYQCTFTDISKLDTETQNFIKSSCSHGLFKGNSQKFRPNDNLTWAEMLAVLSRMSKENIQETTPRWNGYYTAALKKEWITANDKSKMEQNMTKEHFVELLYKYNKTTSPSQTDKTEPLTNELANTTWELQLFDGKAVSGSYTLTFTDTTVNTKFCNTMNGTYTISGNTINATLISTKMACLNDELMNLENTFTLTDATFIIASTKMATNNIERLAITTREGHSFTYSKKETKIGGDRDEHGCIPSAGYSRNEEAQECQRPREQNPPTDTAIENPRDILDGKEFSLTSLNGETISGSYLISFGEGKLSTKFCNSINGSYSIDENGKMSGILMSTLMACLNQEPSTLESKFAIDGAEVKTEEKSLTLTTKNNDIFVWQQK